MTSVYVLVYALQTVLPWSPVGHMLHPLLLEPAEPLPPTCAALRSGWEVGLSEAFTSPKPPAWEALPTLFLVSRRCRSRKCSWI